MYKVAPFARLEAKPGKENEVAKLLEAGLAMAKTRAQNAPLVRFAVGPDNVRRFRRICQRRRTSNAFERSYRPSAVAKTPELFTKAPSIEPLEVSGVKQAA